MSSRFLRTSAFVPPAGADPRAAIAADVLGKFGSAGDLLDLFVQTTGDGIDKWHHYLPLYERYLGPWRGRPLRMLEIGVSQGGSLDLWRRYFGPSATIFGIDIDPACARLNGQAGEVRIGSQDDPQFLQAVVDEMGGVDVVLDDGSHVMHHISASLAALFPRLAPAGLYIIEDLHTAYWPRWGGGIAAPGNFFNTVRAMVDDLHHWYHDGTARHPATAGAVTGIHIHDSVVVLEKGADHRPVRSLVGAQTDAAAGVADQPEGK